jgi:hypothetical protein
MPLVIEHEFSRGGHRSWRSPPWPARASSSRLLRRAMRGGQHRARDRSADRLRAVAVARRRRAPSRRWRWRGALPLLPDTHGTLLVPGALASMLTGFMLLIGRVQGHLAGLRLPDPRERHLPVRSAAHPIDAACWSNRASCWMSRWRVRHRHHRGPHPAGVRHARHPQADRAPRMNALLLISCRWRRPCWRPLAERTARAPGCCRWSGCCIRPRRWLLMHPPVVAPGAWLGFDPLARAVLPAVSLLFLAAPPTACPTCGCGRSVPTASSSRPCSPSRPAERRAQARHLGVLWIATEAVTLAAVPLLHFNGHAARLRGDLEIPARRRHRHRPVAARLVLSGLRLAARRRRGRPHLHRADRAGRRLSRPWVLIAWVLLLVGLRHQDGPRADAHLETRRLRRGARGIVGAMLAGGVTTVAFTALLRVRAVVGAAGEGAVADRTLLAIGLFSMVWPRCSCSAPAISSGCSPIRASSTWASSASARRSARPGSGRAVPRLEQQPDQGRPLPQRGQYPARGRRAPRWTTCAACRSSRRVRPPCSWPACSPSPPARRSASFFSELRILRAALDGGHGFGWRVPPRLLLRFLRADAGGVRHRLRPPRRRRPHQRTALCGNGRRDRPAARPARAVARGWAFPPRRCSARPGRPP